MRNVLLASLLTIAAACSAEPSVLVPAPDALLAPEPVTLSVQGTQANDVVSTAVPRAVSAVASTSPAGPVWIETICQDVPVEAQIVDFKREYPATTAVELGKAALLVDHGKRQQLTAWDTDSNCRVDITGPKDVDTVALARTLLGELKS